MLSDLLRLTDSYSDFGIFKLFLLLTLIVTKYIPETPHAHYFGYTLFIIIIYQQAAPTGISD